MFLHKLDSVINKQVINNYRFGLQNDDINTKDDITRFDGTSQPSCQQHLPVLLFAKSVGYTDKPWTDYTITVLDRYPLPNMMDLSANMEGCTSKINLVKAFHQVPIAPEDWQKTALWIV
jgi:hypothetical protein